MYVSHCGFGIYIYIYLFYTSYLTIVFPDTRNVKYQPIFHGSYSMAYSYFFSSRHAHGIVMSIFHCYVNIKRI